MLLKLEHISKSFGGVKALQDVSMDVVPGEIHALLGENGAGKSTLMKVISGAHRADAGTLNFCGEPMKHHDPHKARKQGISIIYQEFSLMPELSVSENIFLGRPLSGNWLNWKGMDQKAEALIHDIGFDIDVRKKVKDLSVAQQQVVEIAKALSQEVKLLILDEPSAVLGVSEVKKLFALLRKLKEKGVGIIYISHHLDELLELTDRITVLKDGQTIITVDTDKANKDSLVMHMVGRELRQLYPDKSNNAMGDDKIIVKDLVTKYTQTPISFDIRKGEILGIGGLVGSGRTEVLESLFGLYAQEAGVVKWERAYLSPSSPREAIKQGWGMLPEDRKRFGGILNLSIRENISMANYKRVANKWGFIQRKAEEKCVKQLIQQLHIKAGGMHTPLSALSGGNQQKVVLAKWLNVELKMLLIDEPTRGVDVGARLEIYQIIQDLANRGVYIVMVSSDMEELMGLSDRVMVLKNGVVQGTVDRPDFDEEKILRMAIGAN